MLAVVIDTETTGLVPNRSLELDRQPEVIEFYGVLSDLDGKSKKRGVLHALIKPKFPIPDKDEKGKKNIAKLTGISNEMVADCQPFSAVAKTIKDFLEKAPLVLAHNASFEKDVLELEYERLGQKLTWPPILCTVEQSIHYLGRRLTLGELHEYLLGERFAGAHRAEADTEALLRCCIAMRKRGDI